MIRSNSTTERLYRAAGISEGINVLELGCGPGEVSELLSEIVGPSGSVLAVDRSMGFRLPATFSKAGLKFERIWAEAVIDGQGDQYTLAELLKLLKPRLESSNVATTSEIDALIKEIERESEPTTVFVSGMRFCAKARKPQNCGGET